jgi:2'-5' RNA ligase
MRLFIGIPLAEKVVAEVTEVVERLRSKREAGHAAGMRDGLRWTKPESWHITLQFLGETAPAKLTGLVAHLNEVHFPPVPIRLGELGFFERAGVFNVDVQLSRELAELQQRVTEATTRCGFLPENRRYHPHITLARAKGDGRELDELKDKIRRTPVFSGFVAEEFFLYESFLGPGGARYEVRQHFPLLR